MYYGNDIRLRMSVSDSGFRQRNALTADRFGGVTEMPLFSDTIDHGSTSVDAKPVEFTARDRCESDNK